MGCADGLSRSPHMDKLTKEAVEERQEFVGSVYPRESIHQIGMDLEKIKMAQEKDEILREVRKWVKGAPAEKKDLRGLSEEYQIYHSYLGSLYIDEGGVLMMKYRNGIKTEDQVTRIVIPKQDQLR